MTAVHLFITTYPYLSGFSEKEKAELFPRDFIDRRMIHDASGVVPRLPVTFPVNQIAGVELDTVSFAKHHKGALRENFEMARLVEVVGDIENILLVGHPAALVEA